MGKLVPGDGPDMFAGIERLDLYVLDDLSLVEKKGARVKSINGKLVDVPSLARREFVSPLDRVDVYPNQPRQSFAEKNVSKLRTEIERDGQRTPVFVAPYLAQDRTIRFVLIDGEMRYRALQALDMNEILVCVHPHLTEASLYEEAASTHKDSTSLNPVDKILMYARLYEIAKASDSKLKVSDFACTRGIGHQEVRQGLVVAALPKQIRGWGFEGKIGRTSLVYLANRLREYGDGFPAKKLIEMLQSAIGISGSLKVREVKDLFASALACSGKRDEAVRLQARGQLSEVFQRFHRVVGPLQDLLDIVEEGGDDPEVALVLRGMGPSVRRGARESIGDVSEGIRVLITLLNLAEMKANCGFDFGEEESE